MDNEYYGVPLRVGQNCVRKLRQSNNQLLFLTCAASPRCAAGFPLPDCVTQAGLLSRHKLRCFKFAFYIIIHLSTPPNIKSSVCNLLLTNILYF